MSIRHSLLPFAFIMIVLMLSSRPVTAQSETPESHCAALASADFSTLVDAPAVISEAKFSNDASEFLEDLKHVTSQDVVDEARKNLAGIKPFCHVRGYALPSAGFELLLPSQNWNGRFLMVGCGGWCGYTEEAFRFCALHSDYACIVTDMGHERVQGLWFRNNNLQAQIDFSYAPHMSSPWQARR